jgi:hypothetical protein
MDTTASRAILHILEQVLDEYGDRLSIHGGSDLLVSDPAIARALSSATAAVRTPFGPTLTVADQGVPDPAAVAEIPNTTTRAADQLPMDHFTHAVFGVASEDPKYIFGGLKHVRYALRPKGYAVVISLKQESKPVGDGQYSVSLEDKMKYQSKGRIANLTDCLYHAGFELGRIRSFEKTAEVDGKEVVAEVLLAMKWDQLTA